MLRQIIIYDEDMFSLEHEVFPHSCTSIWCEPLHRSRSGCTSCDNSGIFHRASSSEFFCDSNDLGILLTDGDIDTLHPISLLIEDGIDRNLSLSGLTISDNELSLSTSNRHECIDRLDPCRHWFMDTLTTHDSCRDELCWTMILSLDISLAIDRIPERIDDSSEE